MIDAIRSCSTAAMTITLPNLQSTRMVKVLALPGSCFSSRQVVSFLNFRSLYFNHNHYVQFTSRSSNVHQSRSNLFSYSSSFTCNYSTSLEEDEDCNNNFTCNYSTSLEEDDDCNNAITSPRSYDKISGSLSSLSSSSSSLSSTRSCSCNCQNTSPFVQINIFFPQTFQLGIVPTFMMLARLFNKLVSLVEDLVGESGIFFQVAVLDRDQTLRKKLKKLAEKADTSTSKGLNSLVLDVSADTSILKDYVEALSQYNDSFHFIDLHTKFDDRMCTRKYFKELLKRERDAHYKYKNALLNVDDKVEYNKGSTVLPDSNIGNEYTVLTMSVLAAGYHSIPCIVEKGKIYHDSMEVLRTLECIPKKKLKSVKLLWSPRKNDVVLSEDELRRYFPGLSHLENGRIPMDYRTPWIIALLRTCRLNCN